MKPRTLLVLLVLVAGLGSFIWFYERDLPSSEERAKLEKRVLQVEKDEVTAVSLQSESGTVRLEKVKLPASDHKQDTEEDAGIETSPTPPETEWHLRQPLNARADAFAVDGLLDALTGLEQTRVLDGVDPKQAGLDKPRATVRLETDEGETVLRIGAPDPLGGSTIAAVEDQTFVVSDSILAEIQKQPGEWRDRQMYRGARDQVQRIRLSSGVVLVPRGEAFHIEKPVVDRADREKVDDLFAELSGLMAERFVDQPLSERRAVVEVAFKQGPPVRIEVGPASSEELVQARVGSQVFEARTRLAEMASRPAAEWRSQTLSGLDVFQVESATVQDGQGKLTLERAEPDSEPDWKRGEETISYLPVSDFLFALVQARAERLLSSAEAAALGIGGGIAGKPALTVTLKGKSDQGKPGEETLTLYPPVAAGVPARAAGRDVVLLLPAGTLGEIQGKLAEVRKAPPVKK